MQNLQKNKKVRWFFYSLIVEGEDKPWLSIMVLWFGTILI